MSPNDARRAGQMGIDAVIVSNHGGRQLDGVLATIDALPDVVKALEDHPATEVYVDGGFRKGSDIVKALCLGARMVLVGRPALWGLAHEGKVGVANVLKCYRDEMEATMAAIGCNDVKSLSQTYLFRQN